MGIDIVQRGIRIPQLFFRKDNKQLAELIAAQEIFCRDVVSKLYKK